MTLKFPDKGFYLFNLFGVFLHLTKKMNFPYFVENTASVKIHQSIPDIFHIRRFHVALKKIH